MSTSYTHAEASVRKWGGVPEDYIHIHEWLDGTKRTFGDVRHRAILHNTFGVWLAQDVFGRFIEVDRRPGSRKEGKVTVAVREIAEQHIIEDLGFLPEPGDWLKHMSIETWMGGKQNKVLKRSQLK